MQATKTQPEYICLDRDKRKQLTDQLSKDNGGPYKQLQDLLCPPLQDQYRKRTVDVDATVDDFGNSLLHLAVQQQDLNFASLLLLKGANPNARNYGGVSPARIALLLGQQSLIDLLQRHGAHMDTQWISDDIAVDLAPASDTLASAPGTALSKFAPPQFHSQHIANAAYVGVPQIEELTASGNADVADAYGVTPLMKAAHRDWTDLVRVLLTKQANALTVLDTNGYNTLIWACLGGSVSSLQAIVEFNSSRMIGVVNMAFGKEDGVQLTPLLAAIAAGSLKCVVYLLSLGANPSLKVGNLEPIQLATVLGSAAIVDELSSKRSVPLVSTDQAITSSAWFVKGLAVMEGIKRASAQLTGSHAAPILQTIQSGPYDSATEIPALLLSKNGLVDKITNDGNAKIKMDEKLFAFAKQALGARSRANLVDDHASKKLNPSDRLQLLSVTLHGQHNEALINLARFYHEVGTQLDVLHMNMVREILRLVVTVAEGEKTQYIIIATKAIQEASELVRHVDAWLEKKDATDKNGKVVYNVMNNTVFTSKIRELSKVVKSEHLQHMLQVTRVATGAWPPPDAVQNLIKTALAMCRVSKRLTLMVNATGHWPLGVIDLAKFTLKVQDTGLSADSFNTKSKALSFSEYQREATTKILDQMKVAQVSDKPAVTDAPPAGTYDEAKSKSLILDATFFASVDNWVRQFVQCIQKLKQAKEQELKTEFVSAASAAYTKVDGLIDEVRPYYLFKDLDNAFVVDRAKSTVSFKQSLRDYQEKLLTLSDEVILKAKLACGIWPPPNAATEMLQASFPVVAMIREMVTYVKEACIIIRKTENAERTKMESFMVDWAQNSKVRDLFSQWEKLATNAVKSDSAVDQGVVAEQDAALLADSDEGLLIEKKGDKDVIKGGKLPKLVERLVDHNMPDNDYRNVFILTHSLFTNSLDLLDLMIKRYDIFPPYNLDQRQFELYVNRKVVPIRLRVLNTIKFWVSKYTEDFVANEPFTKKCVELVEGKMTVDFGNTCKPLLDQLKLVLAGKPQYEAPKIEDISSRPPPPKTLLPKNVSIPDVDKFLSKDPRAFADIDPIELARQITLIDFSVFKSIKCKECLDQSWEKKDKLVRSPMISKLIKNTNNLTYWLVTSVVSCRDTKQRIGLIKYFHLLAQALFELKNYNAVTSIVAGLLQGPVFRMTKTWKTFKSKNAKIAEQYAEVSDGVSTKGQYAKYRSILKVATPPIVPFLGVFLTDLTFIDLGNPDFIPESNFIAFEKRRKISGIIDELMKYQQVSFNFTEVPALADFIKSLSKDGFMTEQEFYAQSLLSEPREEESDDD